jgi:6-phosphogluconolactonase
MEIKILAGAESVAREGASIIAAEARAAVAARGRFILAVSGGHTPWRMLRDLAGQDVPWNRRVEPFVPLVKTRRPPARRSACR